MNEAELVERARAALGARPGAASIGPVAVHAHQLTSALGDSIAWGSDIANSTSLTVDAQGDPAPIAFRCVSGQCGLHWSGLAGWAFYVQIFADSNAPEPGFRFYWNDGADGDGGIAETGGGYWHFVTGRAVEGRDMTAYFTALANDGTPHPEDESEWWLAKAAWVAFEVEPDA